ncbi:hypothetical protein ACW2QC_07330 [Virgibacillus sp. FSP13]
MIVKMNGEKLLTVTPPTEPELNPFLPGIESGSAVVEGEVPWWDIKGQFDSAFEGLKEDMTEFFVEGIISFLEAAVKVLVDLSYSFALVGGGILILLKVTTGSRRLGKWFSALIVIHFLITFIFA